jgi:hypothetical protein
MNHFAKDDSPFVTQQPVHEERVSIALLMLWTAMSALLLGVDRRMNWVSIGG